jgi:hypothetical protein
MLVVGCGKKTEQIAVEKTTAPSADVKKMMDDYDDAKFGCLNKNFPSACEQQVIMGEEIRSKGWCFGEEGQNEADKKWHACSNDKKDVNDPSKSANNKSSDNALPLMDMDWYAPNNITNECEKNEGPSKTIEFLLALHKPYTATDEEVVAGTVTVVRIDMPEQGGGVRYLRGKDR